MAVAASDLFDEDGLRMLCVGIVKKAMKDYYTLCVMNRDEDYYRRKTMKEFFTSGYFSEISNIDGKQLMKVIEHRAKHKIRLLTGED